MFKHVNSSRNWSSYQAMPKRAGHKKQSLVDIHVTARNQRNSSKHNADDDDQRNESNANVQSSKMSVHSGNAFVPADSTS